MTNNESVVVTLGRISSNDLRSKAGFLPNDRIADYRRLFAFYTDVVEDVDFAVRQDDKAHERMMRDGHIFGAVRLRQYAVACRELLIRPKDETDGDCRFYASRISDMLQAANMQQVLLQLMGALPFGLAVQEIEWVLDADLCWVPKQLFPVHKSRVVFNTRNELMLRSPLDVYYGEKLPPYTFLHHINEPEGGEWNDPLNEGRQVYGHGLLDRLYPWFLWKTILVRNALRASERVASGGLVIEYPYRDPEAYATAQNAAQTFTQWSSLLLPKDAGFSFDTIKSDIGTGAIYHQLLSLINEEISKMVLCSPSLMSNVSGGSYASMEVAEKGLLERLVQYDTSLLLRTLQQQLVTYIMRVNGWPVQKTPVLSFKSGPRWSLTETVNALEKLRQMGYPVSIDVVSEETRIRLPKPDETQLALQPNGRFKVIRDPMGGVTVEAEVDAAELPKAMEGISNGSPSSSRAKAQGFGNGRLKASPQKIQNGVKTETLNFSSNPGPQYAEDESTPMGVVTMAAHAMHMVQLNYRKMSGRFGGHYIVEPYCTRIRADGDIQLFAWDIHEDKMKSFSVNGIISATVLDQMSFEPRFTVEL